MLGDMLLQLDLNPADQSDRHGTIHFDNIKTGCSVLKWTRRPTHKRPSLLPPAHTRGLNPHSKKSRLGPRMTTAVSFLEHCLTPAGQQSPQHLYAAGIRQS